MKKLLQLFIIIAMPLCAKAQVVITNTNFSMGTTGRIGVGASPTGEGNMWKPLNLSGQGSLAGRMEQSDYFDLLPALHFTPKLIGRDSTNVTFQARLGMYSANGQFMGNVSTRSADGLTFILPEAFVEARNIMGSRWSAWAGARFRRYDDIHICDYFYFDDHSAQGFGASYKTTELTMLMPASTDSAGVYPYNYKVTVAGATNPAIRQRMVWIGEHTFEMNNGNKLKLLGEYHYVSATSDNASIKYPSDNGWVAGAKFTTPLKTAMPGSFNDISVRYGTGIANGGDNGNTFTWATYGAPNDEGRYTGAYSLTMVEHFLINPSKKFSINGYGVFTQSKGGSSSTNKDTYFNGSQIYNRKRDIVAGFRTLYYATDWLHLIGEVHYAVRKDGDNPDAAMWKFSFAPTIAPVGQRSAWCRPHIRFVCSLARYNDYARDHNYSPFLQVNQKRWGTYIGVKAEWWIF
ncbi:carbohydrate porin [uncultured Bacteroides sp.]|uniref:carbohydrate porin n=1 Tax=uncultured Bacteroides sp. TaxID=162156 RepID=UPI002AAB46A0|nr:carbohydrate porin [uncultured Bacteroides sp.]